MVYKTSKTSKIKSRSKSRSRKKYKGGALSGSVTALSTAEDQEEYNGALAKQFKGKLKGNMANQMYNLLAATGYNIRYNVKLMNKIRGSYTFADNGYFISNILKICNNPQTINNYYALCVLLRLFYSKEIAQTYSYVRLRQNIKDNCITIYNIEKQKKLIDSHNPKSNEDIMKVFENNENFYKLLQGIMNNTDPINKLKNMELSAYPYTHYSTTLSNEFNQCVVFAAPATNPATNVNPVTNVNHVTIVNPVTNVNPMTPEQLLKYNKMKSKAFQKTKKIFGVKQRIGDAKFVKQYTPKIMHNMANAVTMGASTVALKKGSQLKDWAKTKIMGSTPTPTVAPPPEPEPEKEPEKEKMKMTDTNKLQYYQNTIEDMFKVEVSGKKKDFSYIILFILNNILNKISKLKYIHNDIPYIHNDVFCDKFYKILETEEFKSNNNFCEDEDVINELLS